MTDRSPRDSHITVFGRRPVLETLADRELPVAQVLLAHGAREHSAEEIVRRARERDVPLRRVPPAEVSRISRRPKQDQGVVADVRAPRMRTLAELLDGLPPGSDRRCRLLVLDGVTTPANVGMIIRTATAAGLDGIVLPRRGTAEVGPLVIKASAGVAFHAPIVRVATAESALEALQDAGFVLLGLAGDAPDSYLSVDLAPRTAFVLGGETDGVGEAARAWIHQWVSIPMAGGVESLNVASAAAVVAYELVRRER